MSWPSPSILPTTAGHRATDRPRPQYLPDVPEDPFSGRPLVYRTETTGYVLYSVGQNGIDDGGQRCASWIDGDLFLDPAPPPASDGAGDG